MLQAGRLRVRAPMRSLNFFLFPIYLILQAALVPGIYSSYNRNEYHKIFLGSKARPALKADNLTAICEPIV
jgi:hypothetical protein